MALHIEKTNPELGQQVHEHLVKLGVETPMITGEQQKSKRKVATIERHVAAIMDALHLDRNDDSLTETPTRVAKMYANEIFWGLNYENFPKITTVENKAGYHDMLVEKVTVCSNCENHFVYFGTAHNPDKLGCWVAYIPKDKVVGLSKINRVVEFFSRRPQIQERLTRQIAETLKFLLETDDVAVVIRSQHFCVLTRGIEDADSYTVSSHVSGAFERSEVRAELMSIVNK